MTKKEKATGREKATRKGTTAARERKNATYNKKTTRKKETRTAIEKKAKKKSPILVGNSDWDEAEINVSEPRRVVKTNIAMGAFALGMVLAVLIAVYALLNDDRELLGQTWELSKYLLTGGVCWAIGATGRR